MTIIRVSGRFARRSLLAATLAMLLIASSAALTRASQVTPEPEPTGVFLAKDELTALAAEFDDQPLTGGQVAPRISRFVNPNVFMFLQLDNPNPAEATAIRYVGIGVKGVFCAETQPDRSFTHFHKYGAPEYAQGHGSQPGDQGYWLTWVAVEEFETRDGRKVAPGVDYEFSPTPPPSCGANVPEPDFAPEGADALTPEEVQQFVALFGDPFLTGGQSQPRSGRWVNENVFAFLQFDAAPAEATAIRYIGIGLAGVFCQEQQPHADFTHYHRVHAAEYGEGHAGEPGEEDGYWLLWVTTDSFEARDGRQITPGVDREFSPTPPPACGSGSASTGATTTTADAELTVAGSEYDFDPAELVVKAGDRVTVTFHNRGTIPHTFTLPAAQADTGSVAAGASAAVSFSAPAPGSHEFLCSFGGHLEAGMVGTLLVE